jgi:hypothetical protein
MTSGLPRMLIVGGAPMQREVPEWQGYRCVCLPRERAQFVDFRDGTWSARIDERMVDEFVAECAAHDLVFCESGEALILVTEWNRRGIEPRPILALEVDGHQQVVVIGDWYRTARGFDPVPGLLGTPWVSWVATSEAQASRLEAAGIERRFLHRVPTGASIFSMLSTRAGQMLSGEPASGGGSIPTAGTVLFPGNGRRDWSVLVEAVLGLRDLPCTMVGGSVQDLRRRFRARGSGWPRNLRYVESVPLERYIQLVGAARVAVVPLLPGSGDGGHSTIAIVHRLGVPLVCTDSPALVEYVDGGRAAQLCPAGDAAALVRAVRSVFGDEELRQALAAGGKRAEHARDLECTRGLRAAIDRARGSLPRSQA